MLVIEELGKRYRRDFWGLRHFSLTLGTGVLGLLGPNGAGKSTLMRMLATITQPTEGSIHWDGQDVAANPDALRPSLGYLPQDFGVYPNLSAVEFLEYMAAVKGLDGRRAAARIPALLEQMNLTEVARRPLRTYSGGMKQRVGIAQALLNDPRLLIVDEPTVGLDPEERLRFRSLMADLSGERLVLLSTHIVSDVEAAATAIAIINQGRLLIHGAPERLLAEMDGKVWELNSSSDELPALRTRFLVSGTVRSGNGLRVRAVAAKAPAADAQPTAPTLEDAYLYFVAARSPEAA